MSITRDDMARSRERVAVAVKEYHAALQHRRELLTEAVAEGWSDPDAIEELGITSREAASILGRPIQTR